MTPVDRAFAVFLLMGAIAIACALLAPAWAFVLALGAVPTVTYVFALWDES